MRATPPTSWGLPNFPPSGQCVAPSGIPCTRGNQTRRTHGLKARLPRSFRSGTSTRQAEFRWAEFGARCLPHRSGGSTKLLVTDGCRDRSGDKFTKFPFCRGVHRKNGTYGTGSQIPTASLIDFEYRAKVRAFPERTGSNTGRSAPTSEMGLGRVKAFHCGGAALNSPVGSQIGAEMA